MWAYRPLNQELQKTHGENLLANDIGYLNYERSEVGGLWRILTILGGEIQLNSSPGFVEGLLGVRRLTTTCGAGTACAAVSTHSASVLSQEEHSLDRTCVGELQLMVPSRPLLPSP